MANKAASAVVHDFHHNKYEGNDTLVGGKRLLNVLRHYAGVDFYYQDGTWERAAAGDTVSVTTAATSTDTYGNTITKSTPWTRRGFDSVAAAANAS